MKLALQEEAKDCKTFLDIGCGKSDAVRQFPSIRYSVGVDIFPKIIEESRRRKIHDDYFVMNVMKIEGVFKKSSFDCVYCSHVIEHLKKQDGSRLIDTMERIARNLVIIRTPNGFFRQAAHDGNIYEKHKSGWVSSEFRKRGYNVFGEEGIKALSQIVGRKLHLLKNSYVRWLFYRLTDSYVNNRPDEAFHLLCVKRIKKAD
jgi:ubiquinone/menaquinone biosynthesis C-methylase UbiE